MVTRGKPESAIAPIDLAYVAGLFDGEGSISISRTKPSGAGRSTTYNTNVSLGSTYFPILDWLKEHFGGSVYDCKPTKTHYKPFRRWEVSSRKSLVFLQEIVPYLRIKRSLAELMIVYIQGRENWQPSLDRRGRAQRVSDEQLVWREEMYWKARLLNGHPQRLNETASRTDEAIV